VRWFVRRACRCNLRWWFFARRRSRRSCADFDPGMDAGDEVKRLAVDDLRPLVTLFPTRPDWSSVPFVVFERDEMSSVIGSSPFDEASDAVGYARSALRRHSRTT
jgi:hypothetical protein